MVAKITALLIFFTAYALFVFLPRHRSKVAVVAAFIAVVSGAITVKGAFFAVNWNVMGIFIGTLVVADVFMESRVPAYIAEIVVNRAKNTGWAILFICILTGFISAFVENVATVLIVAPIALSLAKKLKISPVNMMIAIAISSNLQGTATLIGDPPSMLLGGFAKMNFMDFFFYKGKPSIFFAVEIGALVSFVVLYFVFRRYREKTKLVPSEKIRSWAPTWILILLVLALAVSSFFDVNFSYMAGAICLFFAGISFIWIKLAADKSLLASVKSLDWDTALFLIGVFIIIGSVTATGWIDVISGILSGVMRGNIFIGYLTIVFVSVFFSAFVDNVPFLAAMLPVGISVSKTLGIEPSLLLFGLLIGASLGGNITPIGASANMVSTGILKREGFDVRFGEFIKIGLPFTLVAVTAATLFTWLVWHP